MNIYIPLPVWKIIDILSQLSLSKDTYAYVGTLFSLLYNRKLGYRLQHEYLK